MRTLTTCENTGTVVMRKKNGNTVGEIVGSYIGGFNVKAVEDDLIRKIPFSDVDLYFVESD